MDIENLNLTEVIGQVGKEKNLDATILIEALEAAMLSAARKKLGVNADIEAQYNPEAGEIDVFEFRQIVKVVQNRTTEISFEDALKMDDSLTEEAIGEDLGIKLDSAEFGRIAAQNAKQIIIQRVREAERNTVYGEYKDRKGELVTGIVRRFERGNVIVDLGRAEAVIPLREQVRRENIRAGDRVVAYVTDVLEVARGPQIILSRTHPNLVVKLFEQEVPEIAEGIVSVEAVAREAGTRTKIAVASRDSDVDPVGACVGMKGARVQAVVQELRGEKIDIVPFDPDEARFVCNALAPADVTRVLVDESGHTMRIVVPDDQLSLAIGRRGQNVRLAAELAGWKIDITSETKVAEEKEIAWKSLSRIDALGEFALQSMYNHGVRSAFDVLEADDEFLLSMPGVAAEQLGTIRESALAVVEAEQEEMLAERGQAREDARVLFAIEDVCEQAAADGKSGLARLEGLDGITPGVLRRLSDAAYIDLEDVYFDDGIDRLIEVAGLSPGKARQVRYAVGAYVHTATDGKAVNPEQALSEGEVRDAEDFDAMNAAADAAAAEEDAAPGEEAEG